MPDPVVVYVANPLYLAELTAELNNDVIIHENLVFSQTKKADICFADDAWLSPKIVTFDSISQAARLLRSEAKYWFLSPVQQIRRSRLIESDLRKLPLLDHSFPLNTALPPIGSFSLLDKNTLIYSVKRWKQPPLGDYQFCEDKINPPNRAYLKLWEALTLFGTYPQPNEVAVDLGASPGGWTYVMQTFGCQVTAVDKALLDPAIAALPHVSFQKQSAFALTHDTFPSKIDWLLCDVACYPDRTFELIQYWINSGKVKNFIFTIKLQGETDLATIAKFQAIPGGRVIHLLQNKHEATFFYPASEHLYLR